jgi:hypothetical protein
LSIADARDPVIEGPVEGDGDGPGFVGPLVTTIGAGEIVRVTEPTEDAPVTSVALTPKVTVPI